MDPETVAKVRRLCEWVGNADLIGVRSKTKGWDAETVTDSWGASRQHKRAREILAALDAEATPAEEDSVLFLSAEAIRFQDDG